MTKRAAGAMLPFLAAPGSGEAPLYRQLYQRIRGAILQGTLRPGVRLPSSRVLAGDLGVSRNTVELAFGQLAAEGFLERRVGAGSRVAALPAGPIGRAPAPPPGSAGRPPALSARGRTLVAAGTRMAESSGPALAFAPCVPSLDDFPVALWSRVLARRSRRSDGGLYRAGDPTGFRPLREAIATYLGAARGVRCDWRQVLVTTSTQQTLHLVTRVLLDPGDEAWLEDPAYPGARAALEAAGARIVPVPVDAEGLDPAVGAARAPRARLACVTPSHQYPVGVTLSLGRRLALLEWAARTGAWILEDDYDSEFRYRGRPLAAVQGIDAGERVLYAGTFNKVMFPAIRLAYLVVPSMLVEPLSAARALTDGFTTTLTQAALADFISEGHLAAHVRRMRAIYDERRRVLLAELDRRLAGRLTVRSADTGMHVTGWLPAGTDDTALSRRAALRGLDLPALSRFYLGRPAGRGLVVGYGAAPPAAIRRGVQILAELSSSLG